MQGDTTFVSILNTPGSDLVSGHCETRICLQDLPSASGGGDVAGCFSGIGIPHFKTK